MIKSPFYSFNKNSLLVQCLKGACLYYVPQDLAVIGAFLYYQHKKNQLTNGKRMRVKNCNESIDNFLVRKKLNRDEVKIRKARNVYSISFI
ncbi:protein MPODD, putative [Plasmodium malariae]|uniref:Protein MPODD, putative n=1 Tax=Plasmodium malariae TaxID=5858 RepID=A0A1C3KL85_PLAMA|nr:protein MPODD, putative [Plasmodium malariae]